MKYIALILSLLTSPLAFSQTPTFPNTLTATPTPPTKIAAMLPPGYGSIDLEWDPSPDTDLFVYIIKVGTESKAYTASYSIPVTVSTTTLNMPINTTYFAVIVAVRIDPEWGSLESEPSNEISFQTKIPKRIPTTIQNFKKRVGFNIKVQESYDQKNWLLLAKIAVEGDKRDRFYRMVLP